ncbi:DNA cytosine methyltransferase [Leptospira levettii]|uniref:DNA cytosine methyltransferase n=1 Tax=Leptospira levettii TaxID=2023178 RepID=UPI001AEFDC09|nr:DNA cytosine methyltransferase [Leptospira levettii]
MELSDDYAKSLANFNFIDLFAGIGGFHLALSSFGAKCVFASEWDKYAQEVYERNFNLKPAGDITKISADDIPKHDILCGGFPCQAFSISGKQKGFEDTRGTLFFDIARILEAHQPKIAFLENVANFAKHDNGNTLNIVLESLSNLGYDVFYKVLNASNFGLPQARERIYIVCFKKSLEVTKFKFPEKDGTQTILKDHLISEHEIDKDFYIVRDDIHLSDKFKNQLFEQTSFKPVRIGTVNKGGQGERIYDINGHAITLSAYGGGIGAKTGLYSINGKIRKLLPTECSRIMGFPNNFEIATSNSQAYKQFGNSVAINVVQSILKRIVDTKCLTLKEEPILVQ